MFVVTDIEWITDESGHHIPTQLAAAKVDETWKAVASFSTFIKPRHDFYVDWNHVACTGGTPSLFLSAPGIHHVLADFIQWLDNDDVLLWWHNKSNSLFKLLVNIILKEKDEHRSVIINKYIREHIRGKASGGDSYAIAEAYGIDTKAYLKHYAPNDVRVICELMAALSYPQQDLLKPIVYAEKSSAIKHSASPYRYDPHTNLLHSKDCPVLVWENSIGFASLKKPIRNRYRPCDCCAEEYRRAYRAHNLDIIERSQYTYIYTRKSEVYHRYDCRLMLSAKEIIGARKYETIAASGKRPCKLCNPTPYDNYRPLPESGRKPLTSRKVRRSMSREDANAVIRQRTAAKERELLLQNDSLSDTQRDDIYTLTQPRFAFWVSRGYHTFHLRSCPKLQGLSNLKGFSRYDEALHAGYAPCRKCKPTAKHDITLSIPITSQSRNGETPDIIQSLCESAGYLFRAEQSRAYIETSVGKWIINTTVMPIKLEHINLIVTPDGSDYHEQPRLFLSFTDVFDYIHRHDSELAKKQYNSTQSSEE